jgi:hypothetical protein
MIKNIGPVHFGFIKWWMNDLKQGKVDRDINLAFLGLKEAYECIAESIYDDEVEGGFFAEAGVEYGLRMHTALVKHKDIHWLRETFSGYNFVDLSLAIAQFVYPEERWEILENDELAVVVNENRTIVFDLEHFDVLGASASLAIVNDPKLVMTDAIAQEVDQFYKRRSKLNAWRISKFEQDLEKYSKETQVIKLSPKETT